MRRAPSAKEIRRIAWLNELRAVTQGPMPSVMQAEAYCGDEYVAIRNERTERALALTRQRNAAPIREVPDFAAFCDATAALTADAKVIVALGDSRTANFANWPRRLQQRHLRESAVLVVNLADWACAAGDHVAVLEFYLAPLRHQRAAEVVVVGFGAGCSIWHSG